MKASDFSPDLCATVNLRGVPQGRPFGGVRRVGGPRQRQRTAGPRGGHGGVLRARPTARGAVSAGVIPT